jgi:dTDP-4-amino-4,6-dideoxygalactose transaminase
MRTMRAPTVPTAVPFVDLAGLHTSIDADLRSAIDRVVASSSFVGGREVRAFEEAFAAAHGAPDAVGCGSGTDALALALRALGLGPGDEVVVPAMTFVATAEAVAHVGATPVVADVGPDLLLDDAAVAAVRTDRTRAVIPVHLYGHVVPFDRLRRWRAEGLLVVEDAAQAHLGTWGDEPVGSVGHLTCFSFYPGKNLGAMGDGGAVLSHDPSLSDELRRLRDHGGRSKYQHDVLGWCSRLDDLQAAVLGAKLLHLPAWTDARRAVAATYRDLIGDLLVPWAPGAVHHLLVARIADRDQATAALDAAGIGWGIHYPAPLSTVPWLRGAAPAPVAERAAHEVLSLPMHPLLHPAEVQQVVEVVLGSMPGA